MCSPCPLLYFYPLQVSGSVSAGGKISYVPQVWWCQNLSIRENILFGQPMDQERYRQVLHACALELDLEILQNGDESKVGFYFCRML